MSRSKRYIDNASNQTTEEELCIPEQFAYNSSMQAASYLAYNVIIGDNPLNASDWVGAFNGDVCVGARKWDINECNNGICEVPVNGFVGNDSNTQGYMMSGQIPTFKIYNASQSIYLTALIDGDITNLLTQETGGGFSANSYYSIDSLYSSGIFTSKEIPCPPYIRAI